MPEPGTYGGVHGAVAGWAAREPDRPAVLAGDEVVGYGELVARADRVAGGLAGLGVGPGSTVGVRLPRSVDFVVAALGVLTAGADYLPLDPAYPAERLRMMTATAGCRTVLGDGPGALPLAGVTGPLDVRPRVHPEDLAYTMFTSGSTGTPKGVLVTHRGVLRLVREPNVPRLGPDEVVLHLSSTSFDAATFDIWGALANGARLAVAPPGRLSATDVGELVRRHGVTVALLPTGLFHLMVDERASDLAGVGQVLPAGDVLSAAHARRFAAAAPRSRLINMYGPTEVTVATTYHEVGDPAGDDVPIGRPVAGTYVRVLDRDLAEVPPGTVGQLYAGGTGLARGYAGDPGLTADRFVPDPLAAGRRLYATGDLVRQDPDGTLRFAGRVDDQFKKRGFRVDPAEVEAALRADPAVRDAVVVGTGDSAETRRLVGCLLPAAGAAPDGLAAAVRDRVAGVLPEHLVPDGWLVLDAFPLTVNGKVDRAALRAAAGAGPGPGTEPGRALDPQEAELAAIWREVLGVDAVGPDDDFFALGGQSLLASKVISHARRRLGVSLSMAAVFDAPTLGELAAVVRGQAVVAPVSAD
ncbi:MAG: hypothetical protein AVDCRST_MAG41-2326 [uncultured Corynebacteriales bacterium]|uniref:Carrier domain-containing protein n=1 Tax=uncultured Mycobacteriales bacterium TaxID=581187 RepID=A0A6J4IVR2_9ACTN|nr:MAG: hypothetical protein AVDCRST_MAG41-2326 [uncultured Corynebacteriales bacterium]